MKLFIKNMVCNRCKAAVETVLESLQLHPLDIELGEVEIQEQSLPVEQIDTLKQELLAIGFELIDDKRRRIIEKIKSVVIELIHHTDEPNHLKYSEYITAQLPYDYAYLSRLFSEIEGVTIEHYIITQKIEKAKEYLAYNELTLSELSYKLGYSSVAHLSAQFKKITGMTPTQFKNLHHKPRKPLDEV